MPKGSPEPGVLFVHGAATRNGAPIALLHFLRWFRMNSRRSFAVLLNWGGEIVEEFGAVGKTRTAESSRWCPGGLRSQVVKAIGLESLARRAERADLLGFVRSCHPALVYLNCIASTNFRLVE